MTGWIGVEISRSRVRTPGKVGYGLYRVRPAKKVYEWTPYAFTLEEIEGEVRAAISRGLPREPADVVLCDENSAGEQCVYRVPTRWTSAYRGKRDLGAREGSGACGRPQRHEDGCLCLMDGKARWLPDEDSAPVAIKPEFAAEMDALLALLGEGLVRMAHAEGCLCDDDRYTVGCVRLTMPQRMRQREANAAFQAVHQVAREHGLRARHAAKLGRLAAAPSAPPERA